MRGRIEHLNERTSEPTLFARNRHIHTGCVLTQTEDRRCSRELPGQYCINHQERGVIQESL